MILAAALLTVGLLAPYLLRRVASHMAPSLAIAAQMAGLILAWVGVIDLISVWAMPDHGLLGLCQAAFFPPHALSDLPGEALLLGGGVALGGRGLWAMSTTYRVVGRARRRVKWVQRTTVDGLTFVELRTIACTVGFVRPQILVDRARLAALTPAPQRAVIAHERSHARYWHGAINPAARGLTAGLAPWPGARIAYAEIRRHLEAVADDCAARHTSRRDVATAIVEAASPPPPAMALGATGWTRVAGRPTARAPPAAAAPGTARARARRIHRRGRAQLSGHAVTGCTCSRRRCRAAWADQNGLRTTTSRSNLRAYGGEPDARGCGITGRAGRWTAMRMPEAPRTNENVQIAAFYDRLVDRFGTHPQALDWGSATSQQKRFCGWLT